MKISRGLAGRAVSPLPSAGPGNLWLSWPVGEADAALPDAAAADAHRLVAVADADHERPAGPGQDVALEPLVGLGELRVDGGADAARGGRREQHAVLQRAAAQAGHLALV